MNLFSKIIFLALTASFFLFSCGKQQCEEKIPAIVFKEFRQYYNSQGKPIPDSAKIIITFKDCDGDIGLKKTDTIAPYDYNFFLRYFEMVNGVWVGCPSDKKDSCYYSYRIPFLEPEGISKILEGEIGITITPWYYNQFTSLHSDTIKFEVQIFDRALNGSNIVETPMILTK